jgi:transcriptional regulator with XRE-family HTH domain
VEQLRPTTNVRIPERVLEGDFSGWLRAAMETRAISQRMLAARSGVHHSTISRLLTGVREPTLATAIALIEVLDRPSLSLVQTDQHEERLPGRRTS